MDQPNHKRGSSRRERPSGRPRSRTGSAVVQFDTGAIPPAPPPHSWEQPPPPPPPPLQPAEVHGLGVRPLGDIEKVMEFRSVMNGQGIELRRVTASMEGPVENIQVLSNTKGSRSGKGSRSSKRKASSKQIQQHDGNTSPWLDYEGPPGQHAAVWNGHATTTHLPQHHQGGQTDPQQIRRLAMNGSQPCLMFATHGVSANADIHLHQQPLINLESLPPADALPHTTRTKKSVHRQHSLPRTGQFLTEYSNESNFQPRPQSATYHQHSAQRSGDKEKRSKRQSRQALARGKGGGSQPCLFISPEGYQLQHSQFESTLPASSGSRMRTSSAQSHNVLPTDYPPHEGPRPMSQQQHQYQHKHNTFKRSESFTNPIPMMASGSGVHHHHHHHQMGAPTPQQPTQQPAQTSTSPLAVVRNKRANQANWEKQQSRRNSLMRDTTTEMTTTCGPQSASFGTPLLGVGASCTKKRSIDSDEDIIREHISSKSGKSSQSKDRTTNNLAGFDLDVPPPPSPPCTCGKNLQLPPTPPPDADYKQGK